MENSGDQLKAVYDRVSAALAEVDQRDLWLPMMSELLRDGGGPDACLQYLESQRDTLVERIQQGLDRLGD